MALPVTILDSLYGNDDTKHITDFIGHTITQTFSLDFPQAFKPLIEQWANKTFFTGRPIVGRGLEGLTPGEQKEPWTETMQALGKKLEISPKRLETLVNGYFASLGKLALGATDIIVSNLGDYPESPTARIGDYPLVGRFVKRGPERYSKQQTWFYETFNEMDRVAKTLNNYKRLGDIDSAKKLASEKKQQLRLRKLFSKVKYKLGKINKRIRVVWVSPTKTADEKAKAIDGLLEERNRIIQKIYGLYKTEESVK
jgi:ribosomal protein L15